MPDDIPTSAPPPGDAEMVLVPREELVRLRGMFGEVRRSLAVIEFDLQGNILDANENFLATVGYGLDEIVGRHHRIFVDPAHARSEDYRRFWERLRAGEFATGEFRRISKRGEDIWIHATYFLIRDEAGAPLKFVKFARNITAQKTVAVVTDTALGSLAQGGFEAVATEAMAGIQASSDEIATIVDVIEQIAQRTSMLGINAEIAAAHAGEHGRAFAVVAREVRKLAEQAAASVGQIRTLTGQAVEAIAEGRGRIEAGAGRMRAVLDGLTGLRQALADAEQGVPGAQEALAEALRRVQALCREPETAPDPAAGGQGACPPSGSTGPAAQMPAAGPVQAARAL